MTVTNGPKIVLVGFLLLGFHSSQEISFGILKSEYPLKGLMKLKIKNNSSGKEEVVLLLETLRKGQYVECMADILNKESALEARHSFSIEPRQTMSLEWEPLGQPKAYVPKPGRIYRFAVFNDATLAGGGPVFVSSAFRFTDPRQLRRSRHR